MEPSTKNQAFYDSECLRHENCEVEWELLPNDSCTVAGLDPSKSALFMDYECDISIVDLYYYGPISRGELATIVIICDILICLIWTINTMILFRGISDEQRDVQKKQVLISNFAVRIKNLPAKAVYGNLNQLKA